MKKAGRYVTAMIAAVMALNFASFTAAEEVFTEEAAMELPMAETTVELPIEEEIAAPAPDMRFLLKIQKQSKSRIRFLFRKTNR